MKTIGIYSCLLATTLALTLCKKKEEKIVSEPAKPTQYSVRMTDAPGPYTAVIIDLKGVEVTANGSPTLLSVSSGTYNLLDLTNGNDTLIATGSLYAEKIQQIRLILGPNNSVTVNGNTYPLATPSAEQSGLKLQVHQTLEAGVAYAVLLDFDANQSVIDEGNGSYRLKPVIRTIETALSGAIKGQLAPAGVNAAITASSSAGVYSTVPDAAGNFIIKGLPAGSYSLSIVPATPYNPQNMSNITVTTGVTTTLAVLNL